MSDNTWAWKYGDEVVGIARHETVPTRVGNGKLIHDGSRIVVDVTVAFVELRAIGGPAIRQGGTRTTRPFPHAVGDELTFEPLVNCGTASTHKSGGYANGWRGRNSAEPFLMVTCAKCRARRP